MSYNYDQCAQAIKGHRRRAYAAGRASTTTPDLDALQAALDGFAALSRHCPMTPLLWMQYARDTEALIEGLTLLEGSTEGDGDGDGDARRARAREARRGAREAATGVLELALAEFPGCAPLHLCYLESLADAAYLDEGLRQCHARSGAIGAQCDDRPATVDRFDAAFEAARRSVGRGTHVNEGTLVSELYRLRGRQVLHRLSSAAAALRSGAADAVGTAEIDAARRQLGALCETWSRTPMGEGANDEMMHDLEHLWGEARAVLLSLGAAEGGARRTQRELELAEEKAALWARVDDARKTTASLANLLLSRENEVDVAMSNEGILLPRDSLLSREAEDETESDDEDVERRARALKRADAKWNALLTREEADGFLVGLGGAETSRAFARCASFLQRTYHDADKKGRSTNTGPSILQEHVATCGYSLVASMYERALSECPTVESLWVPYLEFLQKEWTRLKHEAPQPRTPQQREQEELSSALRSVSHRAIRNCPYSRPLFEIRMMTLGLTSASNLEPDDVVAVTTEATELGFLNGDREALLHLRLVAVRVVKRRLLSLVSLGTATRDYDRDEDMGPAAAAARGKKKATDPGAIYRPPSAAVAEEARDLLEDLRDMYEEADDFLFRSHPTWSEGKVAYLKHRALTEAYVLCPIGRALQRFSDDGDEMATEDSAAVDKEAIQCFEKLVKSQKPSHPESWRVYIRYVSASHLNLVGSDSLSEPSQPGGIAAVASAMRKTRGLYRRALSSVRKAGQEPKESKENTPAWKGTQIDSAMVHKDYDTALSELCREYLDFEQNAGSEESLSQAQTLVHSKMADWNPPPAPINNLANPATGNLQEAQGKRKLTTEDAASIHKEGPAAAMEAERQPEEGEHDTQSNAKRAKVKTNLKQPKNADGVHKIRIGKMEYPAHPFTIHVSNLSKDTQDMDLVDAFLPAFGAIVHAKILREKLTGRRGHHFHGESKGSGLIQFEEKMSVEQALQQDGTMQVGGKVVKIQRSHMPAVGVVPPGMHRVNPKGGGKMSKRNKLKKKEAKAAPADEKSGMEVEEGGENATTARGHRNRNDGNLASPSSISLGALSFRPRGVRQKPKIALENTKK